jgi:hypothetical protein
LNTLRIVFADWKYVALAIALAGGFWTLFDVFDQLLFFSPVLTFYLPSDAYANFVLSFVTAGLLGLVLAMNVYIFKNSAVKVGKSIFSGSALTIVPSACAGCTSAGFFLVSTFGVAGATASSMLAEYQLPFRVAGLGLLIWAYSSTHRRLAQSCALALE